MSADRLEAIRLGVMTRRYVCMARGQRVRTDQVTGQNTVGTVPASEQDSRSGHAVAMRPHEKRGAAHRSSTPIAIN